MAAAPPPASTTTASNAATEWEHAERQHAAATTTATTTAAATATAVPDYAGLAHSATTSTVHDAIPTIPAASSERNSDAEQSTNANAAACSVPAFH